MKGGEVVVIGARRTVSTLSPSSIDECRGEWVHAVDDGTEKLACFFLLVICSLPEHLHRLIVVSLCS